MKLNHQLPAGEGVDWMPKSYVALKALVERCASKLNLAHHHGYADDCIHAWWVGPDETPGEATIGVDVANDFLRNTYKSGTYYVRIQGDADDPDVSYFSCKASAFPELDQGGGFSVQRLERSLSSGLDTLTALNTHLGASSTTYIKEADDLRRKGHADAAKIAELEREVAGLKGELASEKENNADIFDEETGMAILQVVQMWAAQPNGPAATMLARMFGANIRLLSALQTDKTIMKRILDPELGLLEAFHAFAAEFNAIAKESDAKGHDGRTLALMAGPRDPAAVQAAIDAAQSKVTVSPTLKVERKANGAGGNGAKPKRKRTAPAPAAAPSKTRRESRPRAE